jgi:hypothetical protein
VSEAAGAAPAPYVLDVSVLIALARGDWEIITSVQRMDADGLNPWDAHVAMVADAEVCPILTLDGAKWRQHVRDLDEPLHVIEIDDPEDGG